MLLGTVTSRGAKSWESYYATTLVYVDVFPPVIVVEKKEFLSPLFYMEEKYARAVDSSDTEVDLKCCSGKNTRYEN